MRSSTTRDGLVLLGGVGAIGVMTAVLRLFSHVSPTTAALALLLVVLGAATLARLRTALAVAGVAMLTLNFFFLPPVGTFSIADAQNWIAWLAFVAVAMIASKLSAAAQERAREATKADLAATLLASLSHDLRTPLTAVRIAVENLSGELPGDQRAAQANAAMTELERLTRLLHDILDMARIDAEAVRLERQWVTAADVVDAAIAHVRHAVDGHAIHVEADGAMEVEIDPRLASVALSHVIENAAHYSPRDRPILVDATTDRDGLHVSVTDQGPGIDPGDVEHVFDRFYRGRQRGAAPSGTGMGLAITRGLLAAAGGRVWVDKKPGTGARFALIVPGSTRAAIT